MKDENEQERKINNGNKEKLRDRIERKLKENQGKNYLNVQQKNRRSRRRENDSD